MMDQRKGCRDKFKKLLEQYPDLAELIEQLALNRQKRPMTHIHEEVLFALLQEGLTKEDYPFCYKNNGYDGLCEYVKRIRVAYNAPRQRIRAKYEQKSSWGQVLGVPDQLVIDRGMEKLKKHSLAERQCDVPNQLLPIRLQRTKPPPRTSMRLKASEKMALAKAIRDGALVLLKNQGKTETIDNHQCVTYDGNGIRISHTTPFTGRKGAPAPYGLDIWPSTGGKVFNFIWDPPDIICFKYGFWMNIFVPGSYLVPADRKVGL
jgi:hypothetical protein